MASIESVVISEGCHLTTIESLVTAIYCHLVSSEGLVPTEGHLASIMDLVPTEGHLASIDDLFITEGLHLAAFLGDWHVVCSDDCLLAISERCLWVVNDICHPGGFCGFSLIKGGHLLVHGESLT